MMQLLEKHKSLRIVVTVVFVFFLLMVSSHTGLLLLPIALFCFLGIPYLIYNIIKNSTNTQKELLSLPKLTEEEQQQLLAHPAANFQTDSQKYSRAFNVSFIIILALLILLFIFIAAFPSENPGLKGIAYIAFGLLFVIVASGAGLLSFISGYPRIHNHEYSMAEQYAMQTKTGAWKRIRNNRIWSWAVWGVSASLMPIFVILYLITAS
jgi:hypothetical protein